MSVASMLYLGGSADGVAGFDRSSKIDAVARVGGLYRLIGATTRAAIALLQCVSLAPARYRILGEVAWWQADGVEFDGEFSVVDQGAATHTWGVAGSRATGGLINEGDGAQFIRGLVYLRGVQRSLGADVRLETLALVTGNGAWLGTSRAAAPTLFSGGGLGVNLTPAYACAAFIAQDLETPTLTTNVAFMVAPSLVNEQRMWAEFDSSGATSTGEISRSGILQNGGQQQVGSVATSNNANNVDDRVIVISGLNIRARHLTLEVTGFVA